LLKKINVNASFETLGAFWVPGEPEEPLAGTLSSHKGKMHFLTSPKFEVLGAEALGKAFMQWGNLQNLKMEPLLSLEGRTQDEECSIFGLNEINQPGVLDFRSGEKLYARRFRVWAAVLGLRLASSTTNQIERAAFRFTDVHEWMPFAWGMEILDEEIIYRLPRKAYEVFCFSSLNLKAEITCELSPGGQNRTRGKTSIIPVPLVRISPREPQSVEWFLTLLPRLENFFSLLLGTSVAPKQVSFFQGESVGWLVQHRNRRRQKPNLQLWIKCPPDVVARALASWLAVPEEARAIEKTLLGTLRKSSLFVETEFLGLAQALEAFGRLHFNQPLVDVQVFKKGIKQVKETIRTVWSDGPVVERCSQLLNHGNETSFADRLRRTWEMLPKDFFVKNFGEEDTFTRSIVQTRNYFTHLGIKPGALVIEGGKELFMLNQKLNALLRCVMLIDLGIPFEYLREPIAYQANRWS
jgi:hypothetical protein